jgi:sulfur carrier protein ThiS
VNDEKVSREAYAETIIQTDDDIVLLPPIKGG